MKYFATAIMAALLLSTACRNQNKQTGSNADNAAPMNDQAAEHMADSTIYGTSDEFGMSTFTLISDQGDTLYVTRTANDGTDGEIYGDLKEGERYAMTTRDGGEAIGVLINLTQLERHVKDYEICNGMLIVRGDTVVIEELDDKACKFKQQ